MIIYSIKVRLTYIDEEEVTNIKICTEEMDEYPTNYVDYTTEGKVDYDTYEYNHFAINQYELYKKILTYKKYNLEHYLLYSPNQYLKGLFTQNHIETYPELYI